MNDTFWDAQNLDIEACANPEDFSGSGKYSVPDFFCGRTPKVKNVFCFKLDAKSVPEALATTIRILLMFSIVLAHRWNPGVWARPTPRGRLIGPPGPPLGTPGHPWALRRPARLLGDRP